MELETVFLTLVAMIVPFVAFIFGLVEFLKASFGLQGTTVTWVSFIVGIVAGALIFLGYLYPAWGPYIAGAFFILASGLVASGYYKFADARFPKAD